MQSTEPAAGAPRARYIPELLLIHAEELEYLWGQRRAALHSSLYTMREFLEINERVQAHLQGLLAVPQALPTLLTPRLDAPERDAVFTAAYALLHHGEPAGAALVLSNFATAQGARLAGLRDAITMLPRGGTLGAVEAIYAAGSEAGAAAAAVVLANRRLLESGSPRLDDLLNSEDAQVAMLAWRVVALADSASAAAARPFSKALQTGASPVRAAAFAAAAWTGQPWLLDLVRRLAAAGDRLAAEWQAILGTPDDLPFMLRCGRSVTLGKDRWPLLARYGHPQVLALTLESMQAQDPEDAAAAGEAFTQMTGLEVHGERRTLAVAEDADEFTREFAPVVRLPDARRAHGLWQEHQARWQAGTRWCRGFDLGAGAARELLDRLDLQSRWDAGARAASLGRRSIEPPPIYC